MKRIPKYLNYCESGCGSIVRPGRRFCHGHNTKGKIHNWGLKISKSIRAKYGSFRRPKFVVECGCKCGTLILGNPNKEVQYITGHNGRGKLAWNKGLTKEDPRVAKYVFSLKESYSSGKILNPNLGVTQSKEWKDKRFSNPNTQASLFKKGSPPWNKD